MTTTYHYDIEQRSEEWYAMRRGIVTASLLGRLLTVGYPSAIDYPCVECGAAAGDPCMSRASKAVPIRIKTIHPARTAAVVRDDESMTVTPATGDDVETLTRLLVSELITGRTYLTHPTGDMRRGILDEPYAVAAFEAHYSRVTPCGFVTWSTQSAELGYSPDGLVGDDGLIEIKSRRPVHQLGMVLDDQIPFEHMAQMQGGLFATGREWCDYVSYAGGMPLWVTRVLPDKRWQTAIQGALIDFEYRAREIKDTYYEKVAGLPVTEYIDHNDDTAGVTF